MFKINQKSLHLINLLCIFSFTFLLCYIYTKYFIKWDIFTVRDIQRAVGWLDGRFYWLGPEMSKGGHLPGPFFYFLLFPPLLFGENIYSQSLLWHITWLSLTYTTAFHFITKITAHKESIQIFLILFLVTFKDGCLELLKFAWNPSFAIVFHIFTIMGLYFWRKTDKNIYLYLTGLTIVLGVQVHLFVSVHIITAVLFYCFSAKKNWKPILLFLFFVSSPFFIFSIMNYLNVFENSVSHPYYSLIYVVRNIFSERWLNNTNSLFSSNYAIPIGFLFCLTLGIKQKTKKWLITPLTKDFFIMIIIPCLAAILMARRGWYLYFIPVFLIFFFSKWFDDLMSHNKNGRYRFLIICPILLVISYFLFENITYDLSISYLLSKVTNFHFVFPAIPLTVFLFMNKGKNTWEHFGKTSLLLLFCFFIMQVKVIEHLQPYKKPVPKSFLKLNLSYQDISPLMKRIYLETNWSPTEAMKRLFIIGANPINSLKTYYSMAKEKVDKEHLSTMETSFNSGNKTELSSRGYMIIQHLQKFTGYSRADWKEYLSHSLLFHVLQKEIREEKILLKTPKLYGAYWLIPYQTNTESFFQKGFSNIGQPYYWEEPEWLKNCAFTQQFQKKYEFYYCLVLPGYLRRAGVYIKLSDSSPSEFTSSSSTLEITFSGPIIGIADCCSNYWHTFWSDIHLLISCNEKKIRHILPSMGLSYTRLVTAQAKQFSSPLKLSIPIKKSAEFSGCNRDEIQTIELTFNMRKNLTFNMYNFAPVEKKRIIWKKSDP